MILTMQLLLVALAFVMFVGIMGSMKDVAQQFNYVAVLVVVIFAVVILEVYT